MFGLKVKVRVSIVHTRIYSNNREMEGKFRMCNYRYYFAGQTCLRSNIYRSHRESKNVVLIVYSAYLRGDSVLAVKEI